MRALLLPLPLFAVLCCTTTPGPPPTLDVPAAAQPPAPGVPADLAVEIAQLEDRRDGGERLIALVGHALPAVRARALLALGRIQDLRTVEAVLGRLADPEAQVRELAAFSAGLLLQSWEPLPEEDGARIAQALLGAEAVEGQPAPRLRLLEALGKSSEGPAEARLRERATDADPAVSARAALSLGLIARRAGTLDDRSVVAALGLINAAAPQPVRYAGAYVLAFSRAAPARPALLAGLQDPDGDVRALCARGLAELGTAEDVPALGRLLEDPDPRVAVEAVRALVKGVERCETDGCPALDALGGATWFVERLKQGTLAAGNQPLLALAQVGLPPRGAALLGRLRTAVAVALAASPGPDLAWLDCRFAAAQDRLLGMAKEIHGCGKGLIPEDRRLALVLRELARTPPTADTAALSAVALGALEHSSAQVRSAALELVSALKPAGAGPKVLPLLNGPDPIVAANAAFALAALGEWSAYPAVLQLAQRVTEADPDLASVADALAELARPRDPLTPEQEASQKARAEEAAAFLRPWLKSPHASMRTHAAAALNKLTGQKPRPPVVPFPAPGTAPPPVPQGAQLTFQTSKGTFVVALDTAQAPRTSANLFGLARRGYFDGLSFHRVVPDFVAQGGDPRGDGEGGPGYAIRCEMTQRTYGRGAFGMALSGKDTGGSQFFVTTSPQPHLDGRYTNFGEVVSGMDVVDRLIEGDRMMKVVASP